VGVSRTNGCEKVGDEYWKLSDSEADLEGTKGESRRVEGLGGAFEPITGEAGTGLEVRLSLEEVSSRRNFGGGDVGLAAGGGGASSLSLISPSSRI